MTNNVSKHNFMLNRDLGEGVTFLSPWKKTPAFLATLHHKTQAQLTSWNCPAQMLFISEVKLEQSFPPPFLEPASSQRTARGSGGVGVAGDGRGCCYSLSFCFLSALVTRSQPSGSNVRDGGRKEDQGMCLPWWWLCSFWAPHSEPLCLAFYSSSLSAGCKLWSRCSPSTSSLDCFPQTALVPHWLLVRGCTQSSATWVCPTWQLASSKHTTRECNRSPARQKSPSSVT